MGHGLAGPVLPRTRATILKLVYIPALIMRMELINFESIKHRKQIHVCTLIRFAIQ